MSMIDKVRDYKTKHTAWMQKVVRKRKARFRDDLGTELLDLAGFVFIAILTFSVVMFAVDQIILAVAR